jgi:hypothetical protein
MVVRVVRKRLGKERAGFLPAWELLRMLECRMSCFHRFVRSEGAPAADCFPPASLPGASSMRAGLRKPFVCDFRHET